MAKTARELSDLIDVLGHDERAVMEFVLEGLTQGREVYGELDTALDRRNFRVEALQEVRDALIYIAAKLVQGVGEHLHRAARREEESEPVEAEWTGAKGTLPPSGKNGEHR